MSEVKKTIAERMRDGLLCDIDLADIDAAIKKPLKGEFSLSYLRLVRKVRVRLKKSFDKPASK